MNLCFNCIHNGDGFNITGSTCYLCRNNHTDNRIDWFEEDKRVLKNNSIVKTLIDREGPFGSKEKKGSYGVVMYGWIDGDIRKYAVNFGEMYSIGYAEDELELVKED